MCVSLYLVHPLREGPYLNYVYRDRLKSVHQVWWILLPLLLRGHPLSTYAPRGRGESKKWPILLTNNFLSLGKSGRLRGWFDLIWRTVSDSNLAHCKWILLLKCPKEAIFHFTTIVINIWRFLMGLAIAYLLWHWEVALVVQLSRTQSNIWAKIVEYMLSRTSSWTHPYTQL